MGLSGIRNGDTGARAFMQVDVFTTRAGYGNALAVVLDGDNLADATMQRFACWTNLSECAFVLAPTTPDADLRVRIFTPRQELTFAGHPTVGAVHAMLEAGRLAREATSIRLECAAGVLPVRIDRREGTRRISIRAPRARFALPSSSLADRIGAAIGTTPKRAPTPCIVDVGAIWTIAELDDARAVRTLQPHMTQVADLTTREGTVGLAVFGREASGDAAIAVRAFCPADGLPEDPVTGSANAAIGAFLLEGGGLAGIGARYVASQGREVGRDGRVEVDIDTATGDVAIGGTTVTCIEGSVRFDL